MQGIQGAKRSHVELKNGETISYYERKGNGEPIVLIHGNMTSSKHWDLLFEEINPTYHLIAIDLRGFGHSTYNKPIESLDDFTKDIKEVLDFIGLSSAHFVGWSTGGGPVMKMGAWYPEMCRSIILLNSISSRGYPHILFDGDRNPIKRSLTREDIDQDIWATIPIEKAYKEKDRETLQAIWNQLIYTNNQPDPDRFEAYVDDMLTQRNLGDIYHANNYFNISHHDGLILGTSEIDNITSPVLILHGERDLVVPSNMAEELQEDFGDKAEFRILTDCGHSPLVDDVKQLLETIDQFIFKN